MKLIILIILIFLLQNMNAAHKMQLPKLWIHIVYMF